MPSQKSACSVICVFSRSGFFYTSWGRPPDKKLQPCRETTMGIFFCEKGIFLFEKSFHFPEGLGRHPGGQTPFRVSCSAKASTTRSRD